MTAMSSPNPKLFLWSITAALAGFLFGFDTVVISGAEQTIQALWGLEAGVHGLAMSMALWGTVLGSLIGAWPTDKFGRKPTLLWIGDTLPRLCDLVRRCDRRVFLHGRAVHRRSRRRYFDGGGTAVHR